MEERRIVLIGKTGAGKSSTGNNILQKNVFESSTSGTSVSKRCQRATGVRSGVRVELVDSPGLFDTEMSQEEITREIVKCIAITAPGPHAFVLVIRIDRFTKEEQDTVEHFKKVFGENMLKYLIVLFTKKDNLTYDGNTIEDYLQQSPILLKELLKSCNNRFVAFNNRGPQSERDEDVGHLLDLVDAVVQENGGSNYSNEMFENAEQAMQEREKQIRQQQQLAADTRRRQIEEEYTSKREEMDENQREITETMRKEISRLEREQTGSGSSAEMEQLLGLKIQLEEANKETDKARTEAEEEATRMKMECMIDPDEARQQAREEVNQGQGVAMRLFTFLCNAIRKGLNIVIGTN